VSALGEILKVCFEILTLTLPRLAIDPDRSCLLHREVGRPKSISVREVVHEVCELHLLIATRDSAYTVKRALHVFIGLLSPKRVLPTVNPAASAARNIDRTAGDEKKDSLGLEGPLYGRYLTKTQRETLATSCEHLQVHPRPYYRWKRGNLSAANGGGSGRNKITPLEEKRVIALAKKWPDWRCRRLAYHLEKTSKVFIGKIKVAEILKAHGLGHPFERMPHRPFIEPPDMLLHEPWKRNLLWGMD